MKSELIAVGTELLWGDRTETNTVMLSDALASCGVTVALKTIVGDEEEALSRAVSEAIGRAPLVVLSGGLGMTHDDRTVRVVARVTNRALTFREDVLEDVRAAYRRRGRDAPPSIDRQATLPSGAEVIPNPVGIAPGFRLAEQGTYVVALPGVPDELSAMVEATVVPWLTGLVGLAPIQRRIVSTFGLGELEVERRVADLLAGAPCETGIVASPRGVDLRLRVTDGAVTLEELDGFVGQLRARLGDAVYAVDGRPMERVVGDLLLANGMTLAVAESCTGGLVGHRLTEVPGSSRYFVGGWVTYANVAKIDWLGVDSARLTRDGAVSEATAVMMAEGARRVAGSDVALALTGIAGPDGGGPEKPVGTVVAAIAGSRATQTFQWRFRGSRTATKLAFSQFGLNAVRGFLLAS